MNSFFEFKYNRELNVLFAKNVIDTVERKSRASEQSERTIVAVRNAGLAKQNSFAG